MSQAASATTLRPVPSTADVASRDAKAKRQLKSAVGSRRFRAWVRPVAGVILLAVIVWRVGAAPFVHGLLSVDLRAVAAALVLCAVSTAASAWRWRVVANRLGVRIALPTAIGMYYRSQFLNSVLPGGLLGDVHRAVAHGGDSGDVPQASRAVVIERIAGQVVQVIVTVGVLAWAGAEFEGSVLLALGIVLAVIIVTASIVIASARLRRVIAREVAELRAGVGSPSAIVQVVVASVVAVGCHVAVFAIAVAAVGVQVPPLRSGVIALVVLLGASIPVNIGGWGPREGVAGWTFATAGLGSAAGVAASTTFGVIALIAVAPGAVIAIALASHRRGDRPS